MGFLGSSSRRGLKWKEDCMSLTTFTRRNETAKGQLVLEGLPGEQDGAINEVDVFSFLLSF
jgi:hypothetical protein